MVGPCNGREEQFWYDKDKDECFTFDWGEWVAFDSDCSRVREKVDRLRMLRILLEKPLNGRKEEKAFTLRTRSLNREQQLWPIQGLVKHINFNGSYTDTIKTVCARQQRSFLNAYVRFNLTLMPIAVCKV